MTQMGDDRRKVKYQVWSITVSCRDFHWFKPKAKVYAVSLIFLVLAKNGPRGAKLSALFPFNPLTAVGEVESLARWTSLWAIAATLIHGISTDHIFRTQPIDHRSLLPRSVWTEFLGISILDQMSQSEKWLFHKNDLESRYCHSLLRSHVLRF